MSLKGLLHKRAMEAPDRPYLLFADDVYTYSDLDVRAERIANGLISAGIKKGDKLAMLLPNCPEFVFSFFGIPTAGATMVPINVLLKAPEIKFILDFSDSRAIITTSRFVPLIDQLRSELPKLELFYVTDGEPQKGWRSFSELLNAPSGDPNIPINDKEDVAAIIFTSGTTGNPKGVMLTHHNYLVNAAQARKAMKITPDDRFCIFLPAYHVNTQIAGILAPMEGGASFVLLEKFSPVQFLEALEKYQATSFSGVPTVYAILLQVPEAEKYNLSKLRACICGAAPMPVEVFKKFEEKFNAFILEGYGLTEGTCVSTLNPLDGPRKIGSIGIALEGQDIKIVDDNLNELPCGAIGEIAIKGENVMKGYYKNPEATAATIKNGWLLTGDIGYQDNDGYFYIIGRKKELIIRGGVNIYPKDVEEVLYKYPGIAEAAVVGIPDPIWGEEVFAFIVPAPNAKLTEQEIIEYCKKNLADFKCPKKVIFKDALPKTATGKIQKHIIVEQYIKERQ